MINRTSIQSHEIHIWIVDLDSEGFESENLSQDEIARANRLKFEKDQRRFTNGRAALRTILSKYTGILSQELEFDYNDFGKPSLIENSIKFNLSHSGPNMIAVFSSDSELGVDIEKKHPLKDEESLVNRFFSDEEKKAYSALPRHLKSEGFFKAWTSKEAIIKAIGRGLQIPLDSFEVSINPQEPYKILKMTNENKWSIQELKLHRDHTSALCYNPKVTDFHFFRFAEDLPIASPQSLQL